MQIYVTIDTTVKTLIHNFLGKLHGLRKLRNNKPAAATN